MAFCQKCGTQMPEGVKFCPGCGAQTGQGAPTPMAQANDAEANKLMAILSYIIFFIPLLTGDHKRSPFVRFHANQGTALAITAIAYSVVSGILRAIVRTPVSIYGYKTAVYYTPGWLSTILWLISLVFFAACVYGIYNAATGRLAELPVIGKIRIIK